MKRSSLREIREGAQRSDAALLEAIAAGDLGQLGVLFDRHHEAVRQFALRAAPQNADVDDLVQETFLTAARVAASFDGRESSVPFLIGIAVRLLWRRRRSFSRFRAVLELFGVASPRSSPRSPEELTSNAQEEARLRDALGRLSEERRIVLVLVEWRGMSGVEAARLLEIPVGTVWRRLHEARAELKVALEKEAR